MLDVKVTDATTKISMHGTTAELFRDTMLAIHNIYMGLREDNMIASTMYRNALENGISLAFELTDEEVKGEC